MSTQRKRKNRSSSSPSIPLSPPVKRNKGSSPIMSVVTENKNLQLEGSQLGLVRLSPTGIVQGSATVGDVTDVKKFARYIDSIKDIFKNNEKFNSKHIEAFNHIFKAIEIARTSPEGFQLDSWSACEQLLKDTREYCNGKQTPNEFLKKLQHLLVRFEENRAVSIGTGFQEILCSPLFMVAGGVGALAHQQINEFYFQLTTTIKSVVTGFDQYSGILSLERSKDLREIMTKTFENNPIAYSVLSGDEVKTENRLFNYITNFLVKSWELVPKDLIEPVKKALITVEETVSEEVKQEAGVFSWMSNWIYENVASVITTAKSAARQVSESVWMYRYGDEQKAAFDEAVREMENLNVAGDGLSNFISYMTVAVGITSFILGTYVLKRYLDARHSRMSIMQEYNQDDDIDDVITTFGFMKIKSKSRHVTVRKRR